MAKYGNWFENAQNVLAKIANINTAGTAFTGNLNGQVFYPVSSTYVEDGAISLTDGFARLNSSAESTAMTLAAGTSGQIIAIFAVSVTSACTITPTPLLGTNTTITFTAAGQGVELIYGGVGAGGGWVIIGNNGATLS